VGNLTFREVNDDDAAMILEWRSSPRVSQVMATNFTSTIDEQTAWINRVRIGENYYHWLIRDNEKDVGLISINQIDHANKSCHWGFYIGDERSLGQGALLPAYLYNWLFSLPPIENIFTESFESNRQALGMHDAYGFEATPDGDRIVGDEGRRLVAMRLTKEKWHSMVRFHRFKATFPTQLWSGNSLGGQGFALNDIPAERSSEAGVSPEESSQNVL
jgi:UDP-4-amino-4,6-dideoxy-N-acetyl-beta-L-altrosamine N-acetyltransferase